MGQGKEQSGERGEDSHFRGHDYFLTLGGVSRDLSKLLLYHLAPTVFIMGELMQLTIKGGPRLQFVTERNRWKKKAKWSTTCRTQECLT